MTTQPKPMARNTLFYGDNLSMLRQYVPAESVDLAYLDPPFNSSRSYNMLLKAETTTRLPPLRVLCVRYGRKK